MVQQSHQTEFELLLISKSYNLMQSLNQMNCILVSGRTIWAVGIICLISHHTRPSNTYHMLTFHPLSDSLILYGFSFYSSFWCEKKRLTTNKRRSITLMRSTECDKYIRMISHMKTNQKYAKSTWKLISARRQYEFTDALFSFWMQNPF